VSSLEHERENIKMNYRLNINERIVEMMVEITYDKRIVGILQLPC